MPKANDTLFAETVTERRRLVAILEQLEPADWDHPSLCAGWKVREVTAHMSMAYRYSGWAMLWGIVKARGSFARYADHAARLDTSRMSNTALLDSLADNVNHRWKPPGGGPAGALSHDIIHGLDITEPLGLAAPPVASIRHVLDHFGPGNMKFFNVDLQSRRLEATDTDWNVGDGVPVQLTAKDVLLTLTGRRTLPERAQD